MGGIAAAFQRANKGNQGENSNQILELDRDRKGEVYMFPFPIAIKLKYLVGILALISFVGALEGGGNTAHVAHLSGLLFGYIYVKFVPRRGLSFGFSEKFYGIA